MSVGEIHRHHSRLEINEGIPITSEGGQHIALTPVFSETDQAAIQNGPQIDGHASSSSCLDTTGPTFLAPLSEMGKQSSLEPHMAQEPTGQSYRTMPPYLDTMEKEVIPDERGSSGCDSLSPGDNTDRCFIEWLGAAWQHRMIRGLWKPQET